MPLADIEVSFKKVVLPDTVEQFLREANDRVGQFVRSNPKRETGFVPSNYVSVYNALRAICDTELTPQLHKCRMLNREWLFGSRCFLAWGVCF